MGVSKPDDRSLIETKALGEILKAMEGKAHELKVESVIQFDAALQALRNGSSLIEIVRRAICQLEKLVIAQVLAASAGNRVQAARVLKIDNKTLSRHLQKHGL